MDIVFATNNANKLRELREITAGSEFNILGLAEIGCHEDIVEDADTIEGNAFIKARFVKDKYGYDCFADDTGLEIEALDGAPGVHSARFAGEDCDSERNIDKVLGLLAGKENHKARFRTVIALCLGEKEYAFEGEVKGVILESRRGTDGFGYDSVFKPDESEHSFAEMTHDQKNSISHRGRAVAKLITFLLGSDKAHQ